MNSSQTPDEPRGSHHVNVAVPLIERPDDADALGIGCPHGEPRAGAALVCFRMGAELLVYALVRALAEQVQIEISDDLCDRP